ncbi:MAG: lipopolysaccharide transport periplasmic protein LptA, partial [Burkholderiaceae bacterium]
ANNTAQPIAIEADRMQYDNRRQTNVFIGNVVLSQGGFEIRADRIYMRQNNDGAQFATATGSPARFRHVQPGSAGTVEGSGKELRYNNQSRELEILNDATLRRVQKGANSDEVRGAKIVYRADRDSFVVEGGKGGGRVKVIIQPKSSQTSGKAADLKSSPTLSQ